MQLIDGTPCIRLQGIGWHPAKPAGELQPGDRTWWNYGTHPYIVDAVRLLPSGKTLVATLRKADSGQIWERRFKIDRYIATT